MSNVHGLFSSKKKDDSDDEEPDDSNNRYVGGIGDHGGGRYETCVRVRYIHNLLLTRSDPFSHFGDAFSVSDVLAPRKPQRLGRDAQRGRRGCWLRAVQPGFHFPDGVQRHLRRSCGSSQNHHDGTCVIAYR